MSKSFEKLYADHAQGIEIERLKMEITHLKSEALAAKTRIENAAVPYVVLTPEERAAFERFHETWEDDVGYDVPKEMMKRLAEVGVVYHVTAGRYGITEYGHSVRAALAARDVEVTAQQAEIERLRGEVTNRNKRAIDGDKAQSAFDALFTEHEALCAKLAALEAIANSDDGAGGEGMKLYLENRNMKAKLAALEKQEPVGEVDEDDSGLFVDLETPNGTVVKFGQKLYAAAGAASEWNDFVEIACARIKSADDAAADGDYMLDSSDCIKVLRGTWGGNYLNDHPVLPAAGAAPTFSNGT